MAIASPRFLSHVLLSGLLLSFGSAHAEFDAAASFQMRCSSCHGANGEGTDRVAPSLGPALKGNALVKNAPVSVIAQIIRRGRSGKARIYDSHYPNMPSFGAEVVPDVEALVAYLKGPLQQ